MAKRISLLTLIFILVCSVIIALFFNGPAAADLQMVANARVLATVNPHATPTATPFQPIGPTSTPWYIAPDMPAALPAVIPTLRLPTPTALPLPPGKVNFLILGTDQRSDPGFRTDVIMFVSIDTGSRTVSVISFPRDLYVTIPGWTQQRINTAFSAGGFSTLAYTFQYNFQIRPQYYFLTNFQGFSDLIDGLNGIMVNAAAPLTDKCDLPQNHYGYCTINPGKVVMDGKTALWYVRSRHSTSDFDRTRRAQEVLFAVFTRMMKFDAVTRLPDLYAKYSTSVETNMSITDMLPLLPIAGEVVRDPTRIRRYSVTPQMASDFRTSDGAMVLLPNYQAISAMIYEAMNGQ